MPWKLIFFLITLTLIVSFIGFNLDHQSDISFGFYSFEDVPIFISLFTAFLFGCLVMLPFTIRVGLGRSRSDQGSRREQTGESRAEKKAAKREDKSSSAGSDGVD